MQPWRIGSEGNLASRTPWHSPFASSGNRDAAALHRGPICGFPTRQRSVRCGAWRVALHRGRRRALPLNSPRPDRCIELRRARDRVDLERCQLRDDPSAFHARLRKRKTLHGRWTPKTRRRDRSGDGGDPLDVSRAEHLPLGVFDASPLGKGSRVRGSGRQGRRLHHDPGVLLVRPRRGDGPASPELGDARAPGWIPRVGGRGSPPRPSRRLGTVVGVERAVRSLLRDSAGARIHHELLPPDCGERHHSGRQLRRAGIQPDPHRERPRRHPRLRRADGRAQVEVPRHSPARGVRPRDMGERRLDVYG